MSDSAGPSVDAHGRVTPDPTKNVIERVELEARFQTALREADARHVREIMLLHRKLSEMEASHVSQVAKMNARNVAKVSQIRAAHESELRGKESQRIDAIRQVDVGEARQVKNRGASATFTAIAIVVSLLSLATAVIAIITR